MQMREAAGVRALAERRKFGRRHDRLGVVRRADVRRDHPERAAVEHAGDIVRRVGGNAHERRDPDFERGHADLAAGVEREARMLDVDIERIEASGTGDAGDLHGAHEPHRHRRHHFVALELLLDIVAQDVAYRHGGPSLLPWPWLCAGAMLPGVDPGSEQARTIHELHDRLQVDPRRGLGRGMADARRSRRLLPPDRQIRDDRPHLQPHHRAHPRRQGPPADQPLRHALQGDHGVEPGEDRRRGRDRLETRDRLRHQQIGLRDPRRHPQGAAGRRLRAAHPYPRRHRGVGDEMRAAAAVADRDPVRRPHGLSRLRGSGGGSRRARAHRQRSRSARCAGHAQPRPAHLRRDHPAGVKHHVSARIVLPLAGRRHGGAHRVRDAGRERARAYRAPLSARNAPSLWRAGMARDAAPARGRGSPPGLPAVLALRSALTRPPLAQAAIAWLLLGIAAAAAGSPGRYDAYDREAYLSYLNAPGPRDDIATPPLLRISFGGRNYDAVMDTGSTGVVVSADKIPNIDRLPSLGPGELTYASSGRIMIGRWVLTAMTIAGGNGTRVTTAPIPVLAVTRIECTPRARRCTPREAPRRTSMLGIGFGRPADRHVLGGRDKNPFLNVMTIDGDGRNAERIRRGYIVTRRGVHISLTAANTRGDFSYVKLPPAPDGRGWASTPACIAINDVKPAACGSLLMDTG